jgi:hypothetical protein
MTITLWCKILASDKEEFSVKVNASDYVDEFKEKIKAKAWPNVEDFNAFDLRLWRAYNHGVNQTPRNVAELTPHNVIRARTKIGTALPNPPEEDIHVFIEDPLSK